MAISKGSTVRFNLGKFDAEIHRLARIRAAEKSMKIKQYIAELIIEDVRRAAQARIGIQTDEAR